MELTREEEDMLAGKQGATKRVAMEGLVQLGRAYGAPRMVEIGYAHVHAGMALYLEDVEMIEELAGQNARFSVPTSVNIANADTVNWQQTGAPEKLARLQQRAGTAHHKMGSSCTFTCTPYWAGHWPTWNMHMTSIESGVTVFCNSVIGAKSNRDGYFSVYAGLTGRYPLFGYHLDENRRGNMLFAVDAQLSGTTDFSCLGFHIGKLVGDGVPVVTGFKRRPSLDELDALGVGMATSGGVALFIIPQITPPYASVEQAFAFGPVPAPLPVRRADIDAVYDYFCTSPTGDVDIIHVGCPHASFEEMREYAEMLRGKKVSANVEFWITTSRAVRNMSQEQGLLKVLEAAGAKVIADTCPISCHFARTVSPDPALGVVPPTIGTVLVDSAKQAKYVRDMIRCDTLLAPTAQVIEAAIAGRYAGPTAQGRTP